MKRDENYLVPKIDAPEEGESKFWLILVVMGLVFTAALIGIVFTQ